jgi:molybdate transport system ATP-binding protein
MNSHNKFQIALKKGSFNLDVDIEFKVGECLGLWGSSGSGKTSLLRALAGLEQTAQSVIHVAGQVWQDSAKSVCLPPWLRPVGYVFQDASLFPHLDVENNLRFAVKRNKNKPDPRLWSSTLELLGIGGLLKRNPSLLSGGERQRVAIARALLAEPILLLLDEPLSAIDSDKKSEVLPWLERVRKELKISMVYVTHSKEEFLNLAESVAVIKEGHIYQKGPLSTVFPGFSRSPISEQPIEFELQARVSDNDEGLQLMKLEFSGGSIWVKQEKVPTDKLLIITVLAQEVIVTPDFAGAGSELNMFEGKITDISDMPHPSEKLLKLSAGEVTLYSKTTSKAVDQLALKSGMKVWIQIRNIKKVD